MNKAKRFPANRCINLTDLGAREDEMQQSKQGTADSYNLDFGFTPEMLNKKSESLQELAFSKYILSNG